MSKALQYQSTITMLSDEEKSNSLADGFEKAYVDIDGMNDPDLTEMVQEKNEELSQIAQTDTEDIKTLHSEGSDLCDKVPQTKTKPAALSHLHGAALLTFTPFCRPRLSAATWCCVMLITIPLVVFSCRSCQV